MLKRVTAVCGVVAVGASAATAQVFVDDEAGWASAGLMGVALVGASRRRR